MLTKYFAFLSALCHVVAFLGVDTERAAAFAALCSTIFAILEDKGAAAEN